jgi:putative flippase GtrA
MSASESPRLQRMFSSLSVMPNAGTQALRFLRFSLVGAVATALQYAVLVAGVNLLHAPPPAASGIGFALSACASYLLNYNFTFVSVKPHDRASARFALVALIGLTINVALMAVFSELLHMHYLVAQIVVTALVLLWSFWGHARWSF